MRCIACNVLFALVVFGTGNPSHRVVQAHLHNSAAFANLTRALDEKPSTDLKSTLIGWVLSTDESALRQLVTVLRSQAQQPKAQEGKVPPSPDGKQRQKQRPGGVQREGWLKVLPPRIRDRHPRPLHAEPTRHSHIELAPNAWVRNRLHNITTECDGHAADLKSLECRELDQLLEALRSPEGRALLTRFGIEAAIVDRALAQLHNTNSTQGPTGASNLTRLLFENVERMAAKGPSTQSALREVYDLFVLHKARLMAIELIGKATPADFTASLLSLARAEKRFSFDGIKFGELVHSLADQSEKSKKEANEKLKNWVNASPMDSIRRAMQYWQAHRHDDDKTLEQTKATVVAKIQQKSSEELREFLQVFLTPEGKAILKKFHAAPAVPFEELHRELGRKGSADGVETVRKTLTAWVQSLNISDMQEYRDSSRLFIDHRMRKQAVSELRKSTMASLLKGLTYLSDRESKGKKFEGINFGAERDKLLKKGAGVVGEVKSAVEAWLRKVPVDQLHLLTSHLHDSSSGKPRVNGTEPSTSRSIAFDQQSSGTKSAKKMLTSTKAPDAKLPGNKSPDTKITGNTPSHAKFLDASDRHLARSGMLAHSQNESSAAFYTTATSAGDMKKALIELLARGTKAELKAVLTAAARGLGTHPVSSSLAVNLFRTRLIKESKRAGNAQGEAEWAGLRAELLQWVGTWTDEQSSLFFGWYRRGAMMKRMRNLA